MANQIRTAAVLGAGVMGSGIAAHLAGAGLDVLLLDIVPPDWTDEKGKADRNRFARGGLDKAQKARPAAFFSTRDAARVTVGNLEDDLALAGKCDLVIEAAPERLDLKQSLFARLEAVASPHTIVASNTSGLPIARMLEGRSAGFAKRFLVMHFFNPVRYMRLLELVAGTATDGRVFADVAAFGQDVLGKGIVYGKDTPNFVANRIGTYGMLWVLHQAIAGGFTVEEIDALFGEPVGRPRSAIFRTVDVVGLDTVVHVAQNCHDSLTSDPDRDVFEVPPLAARMMEKKLLGDKAGGGVDRKARAGSSGGTGGFETLDLQTLEYRPQQKPKLAAVGAAKAAGEDPKKRLKAVLALAGDRHADLVRRATYALLAYSSKRIPEIADDVVNIDRGMRWGFGWDLGPFEIWDALGVQETAAKMKAEGFEPAPWVAGVERFYGGDAAAPSYFDLGSRREKPVPTPARQITIAGLRAGKKVIHTNASASLLDLGDGVTGLELHSKMNAIDDKIVEMMRKGIEETERNFQAMVVANDAPVAFSAGANLFMIAVAAGQKNWAQIEGVTRAFQDANMLLRYSAVPVVTAPFGLALGGGAEVAMHGDAICAHAELYMGLVEVGVGLIPAGGGCKELVARATANLPAGTDPFPFVRDVFMNIALGKVSTSAEEARERGLLDPRDHVSLNRDFLISDAKAIARAMAEVGYKRPRRRTMRLPGPSGAAALTSAVQMMKEAHQASDHDVKIGQKLAWIVCGGDCSARQDVSEQHLLDLEREAFLSLCGEQKTQERIQYMLMNNKPLRN